MTAPTDQAARPFRSRAAELAAIGAELEKLLRRNSRQPDLFQQPIRTAAATLTNRTITLAVHEAWTLVRASRGSLGRDVTSRTDHALMVITLRHALDQLSQPGAAAIDAQRAALALVGRTARQWLRHEAKKRTRPLRQPAASEAKSALTGAELNIMPIVSPNPPVCPKVFPEQSNAAPGSTPDGLECNQKSAV